MPPDDRDAGYLLDMLQHARGIARSVTGMSLEAYMADEDLRLALERRLEIIGEAARYISEGFRTAHSEVPWRKIIAQRNVLAHEYGEVDDELVWRVASESIPALIAVLEPLIPDIPTDEG